MQKLVGRGMLRGNAGGGTQGGCWLTILSFFFFPVVSPLQRTYQRTFIPCYCLPLLCSPLARPAPAGRASVWLRRPRGARPPRCRRRRAGRSWPVRDNHGRGELEGGAGAVSPQSTTSNTASGDISMHAAGYECAKRGSRAASERRFAASFHIGRAGALDQTLSPHPLIQTFPIKPFLSTPRLSLTLSFPFLPTLA